MAAPLLLKKSPSSDHGQLGGKEYSYSCAAPAGGNSHNLTEHGHKKQLSLGAFSCSIYIVLLSRALRHYWDFS